MRQTACYLSAATGGLQETMFIYARRSQALADSRSPRRAWTSQLTEFQPVGGVHEQAFHAVGILMLVLMLLIPGLHKAPQQALLTLPYWQHCLQFSERWLELAWTTGSFKILHPRESSSHNEDYRSTGKRPSPRDPPSLTPGYSFPPGRVRWRSKEESSPVALQLSHRNSWAQGNAYFFKVKHRKPSKIEVWPLSSFKLLCLDVW